MKIKGQLDANKELENIVRECLDHNAFFQKPVFCKRKKYLLNVCGLGNPDSDIVCEYRGEKSVLIGIEYKNLCNYKKNV